MKFRKPEAVLAVPHLQERALNMPIHWIIVVATVLVTVGETLQKKRGAGGTRAAAGTMAATVPFRPCAKSPAGAPSRALPAGGGATGAARAAPRALRPRAGRRDRDRHRPRRP